MKRILLALFALSLIAGAADLTTKSGKVYKNYDVDRATPYGVAIFHDGGSATVNRCRHAAYEFMAQIETMNHHARQLADMSYNTTYRFCRDGRIGVPETVTA